MRPTFWRRSYAAKLQDILEAMGEAQETRETTKEVTPLHATV